MRLEAEREHETGVVGGGNDSWGGIDTMNGNGNNDTKELLGNSKLQKHHITSSLKKPFSWSFLCGVMLFAVGLISLFTGHVVSDPEYYSQRLIKWSLYMEWLLMKISAGKEAILLGGGKSSGVDEPAYLYGISSRTNFAVNFQGFPTSSGVTEGSIISIQQYPIPSTQPIY